MFVLNMNLLFPAFNFSVFEETTLPFKSTIALICFNEYNFSLFYFFL